MYLQTEHNFGLETFANHGRNENKSQILRDLMIYLKLLISQHCLLYSLVLGCYFPSDTLPFELLPEDMGLWVCPVLHLTLSQTLGIAGQRRGPVGNSIISCFEASP